MGTVFVVTTVEQTVMDNDRERFQTGQPDVQLLDRSCSHHSHFGVRVLCNHQCWCKMTFFTGDLEPIHTRLTDARLSLCPCDSQQS